MKKAEGDGKEFMWTLVEYENGTSQNRETNGRIRVIANCIACVGLNGGELLGFKVS